MSRRQADPSVGRSAGTAVGRAVVLLVVAVLLGLVLLNATDGPDPDRVTADVVAEESGDGALAESSTTTSPPTTQAPTRPHEQVKVLAANGTKSKGVAGRLTETLKGLGYNALAPVDAPTTAETIVYVAAGYEREGAELATLLALGPSAVRPLTAPSPVRDLRGANLLVVVGNDLAARIAGGEDSGGATTTTARRAATTTTSTTR